jgi:hypothetical protein
MLAPHSLLLFVPLLFGISAAAQSEPPQTAATSPRPELAALAEEPADAAGDQGAKDRGAERTEPKGADANSSEGPSTELERLSRKAQFRSGPHHVPK